MEDPSTGSYVNDSESDGGAARGGDSGSSSSDNNCNLIVNYLPQAMTDSELYSMFVTCGPLIQAKVIRDRKTGYSYGYGFVHFEKEEDATKAINSLNGLAIENKILKVSHARPSNEGIKESNVYVSNMGPDVTEESVRDMFSTYGKIITLNVLKDPNTKRSKGVAFVRYNKQVEAKDAVSALNGTMMTGYDKPMLVKIAEEHGKSNARFYNPNTWDPNSVNHHQSHHHHHHQPQHHYPQQQPHNNYYNGGGGGGGGGNRGYHNHHRGGGHHRGYGNNSGGGGGYRGRGNGRGGNGGNNRYNPMNQGHGGFY